MDQYPILLNLWKRTCTSSFKEESNENSTETWTKEIAELYALGIGMEETLRFLYFNKPSLQEFENWISQFEKAASKSTNNFITEDVLTAEDLMFWKENGYVVVPNVISKQQCVETQKAIFGFLNMSASDPSTWYQNHKDMRGLMLLFTHHLTLDANRETPKIRRAYEQLYNSTEIYKTIDKVSFNPPETNQFHFLGSKLHWDVSLTQPIPFCLQGLLYLTDCGPNDGAFHCVPGFHNKIESWLNNLPDEINPREEALKTFKPSPVLGKAGDFVIWHQALPHCATPNYGTSPRMVQYITYLSKQQQVQSIWK
jgi:ectoine hydroxylase-related dioxygenase (phytanoyl-CoA dioxygenase family)